MKLRVEVNGWKEGGVGAKNIDSIWMTQHSTTNKNNTTCMHTIHCFFFFFFVSFFCLSLHMYSTFHHIG